MATHTVSTQFVQLDANGQIIMGRQGSIQDVINDLNLSSTTTELVIVENPSVPNSANSPTIKRYLELENGDGFAFVNMNNGLIITSDSSSVSLTTAAILSPSGGTSNQFESTITIQLTAGTNPIDVSSVVSDVLTMSKNDIPLILDTHYSFSYNSGSGVITLTSLTDNFINGLYSIDLNESDNKISDDQSNEMNAVTLNVTISQSYSNLVLNTASDDLLGYYRLGESSGATQALDSSDNNDHSVAVNNVTWETAGAISGDSDTAASFAGNNTSYIKLENHGSTGHLNTANWTIACWFKKTGDGTTTSTGGGGLTALPLVTKGKAESESASFNLNWFMGIDGSNNLAADFEDKDGDPVGGNHPITGSTTIANDQWYFAVFTYDGSDMNLYLNGVNDATLSETLLADDLSILPGCIGSAMESDGTVDGGFQGDIDEVTIWGVALSESQIQDLYVTGSGNDIPESQEFTVNHTPYVSQGNAPDIDYSSTDQFSVMWMTIPHNDGGSDDSFVVEYKENSSSDWLSAPNATATVATGVQNRIVYQAVIDGLNWDTSYDYRVIHYRGPSAQVAATYERTYKTRIRAGESTAFSFVITGDCADGDTDFNDVMSRVNSADSDARFMLSLGDNVYDDGTHDEWDYRLADSSEYIDFVESKLDMLISGNHDVTSGNDGVEMFHNHPQPIPEEGVTSANSIPDFSRDGHTWSWDYGCVHVIGVDMNYSGLPMLSGNVNTSQWAEQVAWMKADIANALARENPPSWIIGVAHYPLASTASASYGGGKQFFEDVLDNFGPESDTPIDIWLGGHTHYYERSYPITGYTGSTIEYISDTDNAYEKGAGIVHIISGNGGRDIHSGTLALNEHTAVGLTSTVSGGVVNGVRLNRACEFGYVSVDVTETTLTIKEIFEDDGEVFDTFTIGPDVIAPTIAITTPTDGGVDDLDAVIGQVTVNTTRAYFEFQLTDTGSGIDDSTVIASTVSMTRGGVGQIEGVDYTFSYDVTANTFRLTSIGGNFDGEDITYAVTVNGGVNKITDIDGNELPESSFDIIIDTTLIVPLSSIFQDGINGYTCDDTYIESTNPDDDNSSDANLIVGTNSHALIKFNNIFGDGEGQIPIGSNIQAARLYLNVEEAGSGVKVHAMLEDWNDTDTWNTLNSGVTTDDSQASSTAMATEGSSGSGENIVVGELEITLDVDVVQNWAYNIDNYGVAILPFGSNSLSISSSDDTSAINMVFWLKADTIIGLDDGDDVATWPDSSSGNNDAVAGDAPIFKVNQINGLPVVRFDGSANYMTADAVASYVTSEHTLFFVIKPDATVYTGGPGGRSLYSTHNSGVNVDISFISGTDGSFGYLTDLTVIDQDLREETNIIGIYKETSSATGYLNGSEAETVAHSLGGSANQFSIGQEWDSATPSDFYWGDIGEIIMYDGILTDAQREQTEGYLAHKYGLQSQLPEGHPYKSINPYSPYSGVKPKIVIDYVEVSVPTAALVTPEDGSGTDYDSDEGEVLVNTTQPYFEVQLYESMDDIDDSAVIASDVILIKDDVELTEGVDYTFSYNSGSNTIRLTSIGGDFGNGVYIIQLN